MASGLVLGSESVLPYQQIMHVPDEGSAAESFTVLSSTPRCADLSKKENCGGVFADVVREADMALPKWSAAYFT